MTIEKLKGAVGAAPKILIIGLSNIGDSILMTPILTVLCREFSGALIDLATSPRSAEIFNSDPRVTNLISFNEKRELLQSVKGKKYDLVIDLRDTALSLIIRGRYCNFFQTIKNIIFRPKNIYMPDKHLLKLKGIVELTPYKGLLPEVIAGDDEKTRADQVLVENNLNTLDDIVIIAPGARSHTKVWPEKNFNALIHRLHDEDIQVIITGDENDSALIEKVLPRRLTGVINLVGLLNLLELSCLMKASTLVVTNDSAVLHLALASNCPTLSLFGPTDPIKYAPKAEPHRFIQGKEDCVPCEQALCKYSPPDHARCLEKVTVDEVYGAVMEMLG